MYFKINTFSSIQAMPINTLWSKAISQEYGHKMYIRKHQQGLSVELKRRGITRFS
jgi:hypothetical protein